MGASSQTLRAALFLLLSLTLLACETTSNKPSRPEQNDISGSKDSAQAPSTSARNDCFTSEEQQLYDLVNALRAKHDLPSIPAAPSLTLVARRHVEDLNFQGRLTHGWQDCPYETGRPETYPCMWQAPQRLGTAYPGNGYENAYWHSLQATPEEALESWRKSRPHRQVILNRGPWQQEWKALGVALKGQFAVLWVGHEDDPDSSCN